RGRALGNHALLQLRRARPQGDAPRDGALREGSDAALRGQGVTCRRDPMNAHERQEFVRSHRTAIFGYGRRDHGPAMTVVYYVMDGDDMLVSTMAERAKAKAVARNPKVSLCVLNEKWPLTYVLVYGTAKIDTSFESVVDLG